MFQNENTISTINCGPPEGGGTLAKKTSDNPCLGDACGPQSIHPEAHIVAQHNASPRGYVKLHI